MATPIAPSEATVAAPPPPPALPQRIISTHDGQTGLGVFSDRFAATAPFSPIPSPTGVPARNIQVYSTSTMPVAGLSPESSGTPAVQADLDLAVYARELEAPTPMGTNPQGTICRVIDFPPDSHIGLHRTQTLDYGVVVDGALEWGLDSGESKVLRKGDTLVQRGTVHSWRNVTPTEDNGGWLRVFFVMLPIEKIVLDGNATA